MGKSYNATDQRGLLHLPKHNTVVLCVLKMLRVTELQNSYKDCSQLHGTSNGTYHFQHIPVYPLYFKNDIFTTALFSFKLLKWTFSQSFSSYKCLFSYSIFHVRKWNLLRQYKKICSTTWSIKLAAEHRLFVIKWVGLLYTD